ncbi:MAG TPA: phosphopantetheine-binding protein [Candidatus Paceibacterota bacterium]|nr:phosphopantetheine-binding protein [Candidatus Paceibacterota bacterium]
MIPTHFIFLDALPLNPNGKVDRNALPAPQPMPVIAATGEMLRNETEIQLTTIWAEVLKLDHVGVDANFFQLGGHSLLALQLMMRVREAFAADLPLKALFDHPTVAGLAEVIKNFSAGPSTSKRRITPHRTSATANPMQRSLQEI